MRIIFRKEQGEILFKIDKYCKDLKLNIKWKQIEKLMDNQQFVKIFNTQLEEKKIKMNIRGRLNEKKGENLYNIIRKNKKRGAINQGKKYILKNNR